MGLKKIIFITPNNTIIGRIFKWFGIELNHDVEEGYFHRFGYSGNQKNNEFDILIVERYDGKVVLVPNDKNYYELI